MTTNDIFVKLADRWKDVDYMESETDVPEIKGRVIHAKKLYNLITKIPDLSITSAIVNSSPELKFHLKKSKNSVKIKLKFQILGRNTAFPLCGQIYIPQNLNYSME